MDAKERKLRLLDDFADAFNRHDVDALLSMMTEDCVFYTAQGSEKFGDKHEGKQAVGAAFSAVWETFADAEWRNPIHMVDGERGYSNWTFVGTDRDGNRHVVDGVDLFEFSGTKIHVKDTYRKRRQGSEK